MEVRRESSLVAEVSPANPQVRQTRLWTRGDRFWVESAHPAQRWAWGRDEANRFWIAFGPHAAVRMEADEVPFWLNVYCDLHSLNFEKWLGEVLNRFELTRETRTGDVDASTIVIRARAKGHSGASQYPSVASAELEIDAETRVVRRMVVRRVLNGEPFATVTYTLAETDALDPTDYQLEGHVSDPSEIYTRENKPERRKELLARWFGPRSMPPFPHSRTAQMTQSSISERTMRHDGYRATVPCADCFGRLAAPGCPGRGKCPAAAAARPGAGVLLRRHGPRRQALARRVPRAAHERASAQERGQESPFAKEMQEGLFRRLDADRDGSLSVQEFRRLNELRAAAAAGRGPLAKKGAGPFTKGVLAKKKAAARDAAAAKPKTEKPSTVERPITPEQAKFFEAKIRPVLMTTCAKCHSKTAEKLKGGPARRQPRGPPQGGRHRPRGRARQPRREPADPAIRYRDDALQMPPKSRLPKASSPTSRPGSRWARPTPARPKRRGDNDRTLERGAEFWSFQPPQAVKPPAVKNASWPRPTSTASSSPRSKPKDSRPSPTPTGRRSSAA